MAVTDHSIMELMHVLACMYRPRELQIQDLPDRDARMLVDKCGSILSLLPRNVFKLVYGIKI